MIQQMKTPGRDCGKEWTGYLQLLKSPLTSLGLLEYRAIELMLVLLIRVVQITTEYYPFIDHVIKELEIRFSNDHEGLVAVQYLVPFYLQVDSLNSFSEKFLTYEEKEDLVVDIAKWKKNFEGVSI